MCREYVPNHNGEWISGALRVWIAGMKKGCKTMLVSITASAMGLAAPVFAAESNKPQTVYRCERPGQGPMFAFVPCDSQAGPGAQLGQGVLKSPSVLQAPPLFIERRSGASLRSPKGFEEPLHNH